jgi:hypothetical protein
VPGWLVEALALQGTMSAYLGTLTTLIDWSIRTQRAGHLSCGTTNRNGPNLSPRGAPFSVSATINFGILKV